MYESTNSTAVVKRRHWASVGSRSRIEFDTDPNTKTLIHTIWYRSARKIIDTVSIFGTWKFSSGMICKHVLSAFKVQGCQGVEGKIRSIRCIGSSIFRYIKMIRYIGSSIFRYIGTSHTMISNSSTMSPSTTPVSGANDSNLGATGRCPCWVQNGG